MNFGWVSTGKLPTRAGWISLSILVLATLASSYLFQSNSVATDTVSQALTQIEQIKARGYVKVITRNSPTTYFEDRDVPAGFEYEMARRFADALGVELKITVAPTMEDLIALVEIGEVDFAAAGLTVTSDRKHRIRFAPSYLQVKQQLIYNKRGNKPTSLQSLTEGKLVVVAGSSHAEYLRRVQKTLLPSLTWIETSDLEAIDLLHMVANGEIDFTIVDSHEYDVVRGFLTDLADAFEISSQQSLAWAISKNIADRSLQYAMESFFIDLRSKGTLLQLQDRYFGHLEDFDHSSAVAFSRLKAKRLKRYKSTFERAAKKYQLEWELLAAIGYQESHWNPKARSRTGVRGLMMLTRPTAKLMGVKDRTDAAESIEGGAKYFAQLLTKFQHIAEPERTWFALASYNVGYGHLLDAQSLTRQQGGDPEKWLDVKKRLPLLSQKQWYSKTKYGYARGYEPVRYVENIRRYYDMLVWHTNPHQPAIEPEDGSLLAASSIITVPPLL